MPEPVTGAAEVLLLTNPGSERKPCHEHDEPEGRRRGLGNELGETISELTSRSANGVDVALLWRQRDDIAIVAVADHRTGEAFLLDVHEHDNALDVFHHPYAYAAHRAPTA